MSYLGAQQVAQSLTSRLSQRSDNASARLESLELVRQLWSNWNLIYGIAELGKTRHWCADGLVRTCFAVLTLKTVVKRCVG